MATYIILSRIGPDAFTKDFKKMEADLDARIKAQCPGVHWRESYMTLGRYDVVDIVEGNDPEEVARATTIIRGLGRAMTETMPAQPWKEFVARL